MAQTVRNSLTGADQYSDVLNGTEVFRHRRANGLVQISIWGTFTATVSLQRRFNDEGGAQQFRTTDTFTGPFEGQFLVSDVADYRVGIETGNYTSGTVEVRLGV